MGEQQFFPEGSTTTLNIRLIFPLIPNPLFGTNSMALLKIICEDDNGEVKQFTTYFSKIKFINDGISKIKIQPIIYGFDAEPEIMEVRIRRDWQFKH